MTEEATVVTEAEHEGDQVEPLLEMGVSRLFGTSGGKAHLVSRLLPMFPPHRRYVEPYAGGASTFFAMDPAQESVLADLDPEKVWLYQTAKEMTDAEVEALSKMEWTKTQAKRERIRLSSPSSKLGRFHRDLYLRISGFASRPEEKFSKHQDGQVSSLPRRLPKLRERLRRAKILHQDGVKTIREFDGPETFFFLDPPWPGFKQKLGERDFKAGPLVDALRRVAGKFLLIYQGEGFDALASAKGVRMLTPSWLTFQTSGGGTQGRKPYKILMNYEPGRAVRASCREEFMGTLELASPQRVLRVAKAGGKAGFLQGRTDAMKWGPDPAPRLLTNSPTGPHGEQVLQPLAFGVVVQGEPEGPWPGLTAVPPELTETVPTVELKRLREDSRVRFVPLEVVEEFNPPRPLKEWGHRLEVPLGESFRLLEEALDEDTILREERTPGKRVGRATYLHRSAISGKLETTIRQALRVLERDRGEPFPWDVVKVTADGAVTFVHVPRFDQDPEPALGATVRVSPSGEVTRRAPQDDPPIYHDKWRMVRDSYAGFSVEEAKRRSDAWRELDPDSSRIGRRSYWEREVVPQLQEEEDVGGLDVPLAEGLHGPGPGDQPVTPKLRRELEKVLGVGTAIHRTEGNHRPLAIFREAGLVQGDVLDFGSGKGGHGLPSWDPFHAPNTEALQRRYDTVLCSFVLNVLPHPELRREVLLACQGLLKPGGRILVSVWRKAEEDLVTPRGFQCGWSEDRWESFLSETFKVRRLDGPRADGVFLFALEPGTQLQEQRTWTVRSPAQGLRAIRDPAITQNFQRGLRWTPKHPAAVLLPCAGTKPFSRSPSHRAGYLPALEGKAVDLFVVSEPLGVVPYSRTGSWPNESYDFPPEFLNGEAKAALVERIGTWFARMGKRYRRVYLALPEHHAKLVRAALGELEDEEGMPKVVDATHSSAGALRATGTDYKAWLRRRVAEPVVEDGVKLAEATDPYLQLPHGDHHRSYVVQAHFRGRSLHHDLRMASPMDSEIALGWTLEDQLPGSVEEPVLSLADARREPAAKKAKVDWSSGEFSQAIRADRKLPHPARWLELEGEVKAGTPGAQQDGPGIVLPVDRGELVYGTQGTGVHEVFLGGGRLRGRLVFAKTEDGAWLATQPEDQLPIVLARDATVPPEGNAAFPRRLRQAIPPQLRFWELSEEGERRKVRDLLVRALRGDPRRMLSGDPWDLVDVDLVRRGIRENAEEFLARSGGRGLVDSGASKEE